MQFENDYIDLLLDNRYNGEYKEGRNGRTLSVFGKQLVIKELNYGCFPILQGRKMWYTGVLGELAAFLKGPKLIQDFEMEGCNYWKPWANEYDEIEVDYGNAWTAWEDNPEVNQLATVIDELQTNPNSRRHLIVGWNPAHVLNNELSLPCCHYSYQWYVRNGTHLDMIWIQRSVDLMVGLPSDIILATAFNIVMAKLTGYKPGTITMQLGDCHIYEQHIEGALKYLDQSLDIGRYKPVTYKVSDIPTYWNFTKNDIELIDYQHSDSIKFEVIK